MNKFSEKTGVPRVPGVPASTGAGLRRNTGKTAGVPGVPKTARTAGFGNTGNTLAKRGVPTKNPAFMRLEHREHMGTPELQEGSAVNRQKKPARAAVCASQPAVVTPSAPLTGLLIYRKTTLLPRLGVSETTLRRWIETDGFPRPRQLGPRAVGWVAAQVDQWLAERPVACGHGPA